MIWIKWEKYKGTMFLDAGEQFPRNAIPSVKPDMSMNPNVINNCMNYLYLFQRHKLFQ